MDDITVNEIATVSIEILTQIEKHEIPAITELYRKSNIPIYYKQSNFTYYFIKYIDILNFFILDKTIKLNEVIPKIKQITWYEDNPAGGYIGIETVQNNKYDTVADNYLLIAFIKNLNIVNIVDFSKFKTLNQWFINNLKKFGKYKFRVLFNGTNESNNVNDYILLTRQYQKKIIPLIENRFKFLDIIYRNFEYQFYKQLVDTNNKINSILNNTSKHEIFDISELQNIFSSFDKKDDGIENINVNDTIKKNNKILIDLLYFINNGQINTRQSKEVQEMLNSIITKLKDLPDTNTKIIDIIEDVFSLSLTSNRIGKTFNADETKILNMQNQASETLKDLIDNKIVKQGDYFISSTTGDIRDSTIYLLERYKYSNDNKNLYVNIIGINPLSGEKEKMHFDLMDKTIELNNFFNKCDYVRIKNMKEITPKDRQGVKLIGKYTYKI